MCRHRLITVSNELGEPRFATFKGTMAPEKRADHLETGNIGVDPPKIGAKAAARKCSKLFQPVRAVNVKSSPARMKKKLRQICQETRRGKPVIRPLRKWNYFE